MGVTGRIYRGTSRPIPLSTGTCIQWRDAGVFDQLMETLHGEVRIQAKKKENGRR
jgi:hypothetical protein